MTELLAFVFRDFWTFVGCLLLMYMPYKVLMYGLAVLDAHQANGHKVKIHKQEMEAKLTELERQRKVDELNGR